MRNGFAHPDGLTNLDIDEIRADHERLQRDLESTSEHWEGVLDRAVTIEFAQVPVRHVTGHMGNRDDYDGADDYRLQVRVDGFVVTVHSLLQAEDYLERVWG